MIFESSAWIDRPPAEVYAVYADVERWPEWTASTTLVERLEPGPLQVGSRARVRQPRLPTAIWTVTVVEPDHQFVWMARSPGITSIGRHMVEPQDGGSLVRAVVEQHGPLGFVVGTLTARLTRRYLALESAGLKARCEQPGP